MCSEGCGSTAVPFGLSPFSLVIVSYSPVPFLCFQTVCLPFRSSFPVLFPSSAFDPFLQCLVSLQLSLRTHRDFFPACSPSGAQPAPAPDIQSSFMPHSTCNVQRLPHNLSSVLWKVHCWRFWENYFYLSLQSEVVRLLTTLQAHVWFSQAISAHVPVGQDTGYRPDPFSKKDISVWNWV